MMWLTVEVACSTVEVEHLARGSVAYETSVASLGR